MRLVMITNFIFNDIVLYSKGWYKSHGDILDERQRERFPAS